MKYEWALEPIYAGLEDPAYEADVKQLEAAVENFAKLVADAKTKAAEESAEAILVQEEEIMTLLMKLEGYLSLRQSVESENGDIMAQLNRIMRIYAGVMATEAAAQKILAQIEDVDALAKESEIVAAYSFMLKETKQKATHLLSDDVEEMISAMDMTGGSAWAQLQSYLTSVVKVDYDGKQITLTEARNLANSADAAVRKAAYEAELAAYEKIDDALAKVDEIVSSQIGA